MEYTICPKGHYFYPSVNSFCPICEAENRNGTSTETVFTNFTEQVNVSTEPINGSAGFTGNYADRDGATENIGSGFCESNIGMTEPLPTGASTGYTEPLGDGFTPFRGSDYTTPLNDDLSGGFAYTTPIVEDYDVTRSISQRDDPDFIPVVGWLVAVSGPSKGSDFKIRSGYNYIGRDNTMDICIPGDMELSRKKAAVIGYDSVERLFLLGPSEGKNFVRVNGKVVIGQTEIKSFDRLKIGSTEMVFIALCGERFGWDE